MSLPIPSKQTQHKIIKEHTKPQTPPEPTPWYDKYTLPPDTFPIKIAKKTKKNSNKNSKEKKLKLN